MFSTQPVGWVSEDCPLYTAHFPSPWGAVYFPSPWGEGPKAG